MSFASLEICIDQKLDRVRSMSVVQHANKKKTHAIIRLRGRSPMIRQRRRQLGPFPPPRHERPILVLVPIPLIRIIAEVLRIRTVVRRIHDEHVGREVVATSVPEPHAHLARVAGWRRFLHRRPRRLQDCAFDGGRWEWVLASVSQRVSVGVGVGGTGAALDDGIWIARAGVRRGRGRG